MILIILLYFTISLIALIIASKIINPRADDQRILVLFLSVCWPIFLCMSLLYYGCLLIKFLNKILNR